MKTIMVFDVPASMGGALTILNSFYDFAKKCRDINWIFVVSISSLSEQENIRVLCFEWIKKSWLHRLFFDVFISPRLVAQYNPDSILSLQNICIHAPSINQVLYVHQPIPFTDTRFHLSDGIKLWTYQHIISKRIIHSIKKANHTIVQTKWMRSSVINKTRVSEEKVLVIPPEYKISTKCFFVDNNESRKTFFYPVAPNAYKNHKIIVEAARLLIEDGITDFSVVFTYDRTISLDGVRIDDVPQIVFSGRMPLNGVYEMMSRSTLVFPSKLETFGLPMLEASCIKARILACDKPFAHDILDGYPNVDFFDVDNPKQLYELMKITIENKRIYSLPDSNWYSYSNTSSGWGSVIKLL